MEIITGVERRRQWRDEEKLRILAELDQPGVKFSEVARRHDISRGLLWQWRDAQRREPVFVPLRVMPELPPPEPQPEATRVPSPEPGAEPYHRIEIVLPDGTAVRMAESISTTALRRILAALRA